MNTPCKNCPLNFCGCKYIEKELTNTCPTVIVYNKGYNDAIKNAIRFLYKYATFEHPRKGTEECIVNIAKFKEYMKKKE